MSLTALVSAADGAIASARKDNSIISGRTEPNQVARLVTSLPKFLVDAWHPYVKSGGITVSAAFCHAKPQVEWTSPLAGNPLRAPELADLLFIFDVANNSGTRDRRSLLIQAKTSLATTCKLSTDGDLTQRYMYAHWPQMTLKGVPSTFTVPRPLSLAPHGPDEQARYACFDTNPSVKPAWTMEKLPATIPNPTGLPSFAPAGPVHLSLGSSLGAGLVDLYTGNLGRACDIPGDHWSELTEYLERYISTYVPSSNLKTFPAVSVNADISPLPLVAASSFFATFPISFPRHSKSRHLLPDMDDWVDVSGLRQASNSGQFYDWPRHNTLPPAQAWDLDQPGFGVIRVVIDEPLNDDMGDNPNPVRPIED